MSAKVHMDEENPHMHLVFIPVVHTTDKKGNTINKITCSEFLKAKDSYRQLQNAFHSYITANGFDLERGNPSERVHLSVEDYKKITNFKNTKLENLYNDLNKEIVYILPIQNNDILEECRQYEPEYRNETRFYLDSINKLDFGVYSSGTFRFRKFSSLNDFINFYNENSNKYIIIDEYNREFTLEEFLEYVNLK